MIVIYVDQNKSCVAINIYSGIRENKIYNVRQLCKSGDKKQTVKIGKGINQQSNLLTNSM